jgi:SAM-dependent methyltransferase
MKSAAVKLARSALRRAGLAVTRARYDDAADYHRLYPADSVANRRFHNVGAGSFFHPCWTNLDYVSEWYKDIQKNVVHYDLLADNPLPIEDGTAEIIYTSHTVEHVTEEAVARLFRNAFKALKPGGIFRVTTGPDADLDFAAMIRGDADWFYWDNAPFDSHMQSIHRDPPNTRPLEERWLHHVASELAPNDRSPAPRKFTAPEIRQIIAEKGKEGALDYFTGLCTWRAEHIGSHITWWNADKLIRFLKEAGFETVYRSGYTQSAAHVLRNPQYFDNTHPQMSVYVEAVR